MADECNDQIDITSTRSLSEQLTLHEPFLQVVIRSVAMGFLSSKGQWPTTDQGAQSTIFYARTFRLQVAVLLALIALFNASLVIMAIVSTVAVKYTEIDRETGKAASGFKALAQAVCHCNLIHADLN